MPNIIEIHQIACKIIISSMLNITEILYKHFDNNFNAKKLTFTQIFLSLKHHASRWGWHQANLDIYLLIKRAERIAAMLF